MKETFKLEKELLKMKGDALRIKLFAQTNATKKEILEPFDKLRSLGSYLNNPISQSLLIDLIGKKILTKRNFAYSVIALAVFYLIKRK
ncbi:MULTISPECIES: hypothetical protein [Campylobacter]|uniref:hypothetical protein n=1 Tax=Campylobacter TaxID=194 RepID=UPI00147045A7|nr:MULTISPECIES: hypothetical protein [Campylobacter]MBN7287618.1 hypothetical protein [Campylobacter curvus]MDU6826511.1 hypothetical protein [Campylobacter sp.]